MQNVVARYQNLFLRSEEGMGVLGHMLDEVQFFDPPTTDAQAGDQDHCKIILRRCGIGTGLKGRDYVKALRMAMLPGAVPGDDTKDTNEV
jgi:hypothetical protein